MSNRGIKFIGNPEDHTGYGRAGLYMLEAMHSANIPIVLQPVRFLQHAIELPQHIKKMQSARIKYHFVFIELTPEHFPIYREPGKYNIGYFFWETDRIPAHWVDCCNRMEEIWVPCQSNANACIKSGVKVPVVVVPQPTPRPNSDGRIWVPNTNSDTYIFYSVFQWTARKNPECLLRAYWSAFHNNENVILMLKTYSASDSDQDVDTIKKTITRARERLASELGTSVNRLAKVYYVSKILSDKQVECFQNTGHCFVTAARGEGWNIPAAEALLDNKPIISPAYGGIVDFMKESEYLSVRCNRMIPVEGMPWIKWYENNQKWCDPSESEISKQMRKAFDRRIMEVPYGNIADLISIRGVGKTISELLSKR